MKKTKKRVFLKIVLITLAVIAAVCAAAIAANVKMKSDYGKKIDTAPSDMKFDCILILGAKVFPDGTVSKMLSDRLDCGIELYFAGAADKIIVSGDHGTEEYDEVNTMKDYCISQGVPSEDVFMDHAGFSTYDSVVRAKKVFLCQSVLIVSQKYHLYRALYIADKTGLEAYGAAAADIRYAGQFKRDVREFAARIKDIFTVMTGAEPRYTGEPIPISGSGDATNDKK